MGDAPAQLRAAPGAAPPEGGAADAPRRPPGPAICATVFERDAAAALRRMAAAAPDCALIELRLDALVETASLEALVRAAPRPVVATCRPRREGGAFTGSEATRLELLRRAAHAGAAWVDVEWDAVDALGPLPERVRLLVSRHVLEPLSLERRADRRPGDAQVEPAGERQDEPHAEPGRDPERSADAARSAADALEARARALLATVRHPRADAQKLALPVACARVALRLLAVARAESKPTILIGLGFPGAVTRLATPNAPFTYASADPDLPAAPGQLWLPSLARLLAGRALGPDLALYGVVGRPLAGSRSPWLMNAAFAALGEDAVYAWLETRDALGLLDEAPPQLRGLSVTMPHKVALARSASVRLAPEARSIGAVNTLVRLDPAAEEPTRPARESPRAAGRGSSCWSGHNTDALAAERLLARALGDRARGASAAVLGAGGAARAVVWALGRLGARVRLFARDAARGRATAAELGVAWGGELAAVARAAPQVIVNATPIGMQRGPAPGASPVAASALGPGVLVYELVVEPLETPLLALARARGAETIVGLEHFTEQARAQLALWLGEARAARLSTERLTGWSLPPTPESLDRG